MNFSDWFDPYDMKHMAALKHFIQNGKWPEGFLPTHCNSNMPKELGILANKLAMLVIENYEEIMPMLNIKKILAEIKKKKDENKYQKTR